MKRTRLAVFALAPLLPAALFVGCGDDAVFAVARDAATETAEVAPPDAGQPADASPAPRGDRVLGIAVDPARVAFPDDVLAARDAGARATRVAFAWDEIERPFDAGADAADGGDAGPVTALYQPGLHIANLVLEAYATGATLSIDALDRGGPRLPADLVGRDLDDAEVGARFERAADYALEQVRDLRIDAFLVGSSVDLALGDEPARWATFATFFARAAAHVRAARPGTRVGFSVTAEGAPAQRSRLAPLWASADLVAVSYLGVDGAAQVRAPGHLTAALDAVVSAAPPDKPLALVEVGFPSAAACGSDEPAQAAFVGEAFRAWDRHAARIGAMTFVELDDLPSPEAAARARRLGRADPAFAAMLGSLGLRGVGPRAKPSLAALVGEARARGF